MLLRCAPPNSDDANFSVFAWVCSGAISIPPGSMKIKRPDSDRTGSGNLSRLAIATLTGHSISMNLKLGMYPSDVMVYVLLENDFGFDGSGVINFYSPWWFDVIQNVLPKFFKVGEHPVPILLIPFH